MNENIFARKLNPTQEVHPHRTAAVHRAIVIREINVFVSGRSFFFLLGLGEGKAKSDFQFSFTCHDLRKRFAASWRVERVGLNWLAFFNKVCIQLQFNEQDVFFAFISNFLKKCGWRHLHDDIKKVRYNSMKKTINHSKWFYISI